MTTEKSRESLLEQLIQEFETVEKDLTERMSLRDKIYIEELRRNAEVGASTEEANRVSVETNRKMMALEEQRIELMKSDLATRDEYMWKTLAFYDRIADALERIADGKHR